MHCRSGWHARVVGLIQAVTGATAVATAALLRLAALLACTAKLTNGMCIFGLVCDCQVQPDYTSWLEYCQPGPPQDLTDWLSQCLPAYVQGEAVRSKDLDGEVVTTVN